MRQIRVEKADLEACVSQAQQERLLLTRKGRPVALIVGVEGLDPKFRPQIRQPRRGALFRR